MKFSTAIAAAIIAATSSLASPLPQSVPAAPNRPSTGTILYPIATSQYNVWTGAVNYGQTRGLISKTGTTADITTLVTFDVPSGWSGSKCQLFFNLGATDPAPTGSQRADVFTSLGPANGPTTTWPNGNLRDQFEGRLVAVAGGSATWEQVIDGIPVFDCPDAGLFGGELVGVYDQDHIEWNIQTGGPEIHRI